MQREDHLVDWLEAWAEAMDQHDQCPLQGMEKMLWNLFEKHQIKKGQVMLNKSAMIYTSVIVTIS